MSQVAGTDVVSKVDQYRLEEPEQEYRKEYQAQIEKGEDGWLIAKCPELNVVTQGKNLDEVQLNVIEAIELALDNDNQFTVRMAVKPSD